MSSPLSEVPAGEEGGAGDDGIGASDVCCCRASSESSDTSECRGDCVEGRWMGEKVVQETKGGKGGGGGGGWSDANGKTNDAGGSGGGGGGGDIG